MIYKSNLNPMFRSKFAEDIFNHKYKHEGAETWAALAKTLVYDVCVQGQEKPMAAQDVTSLIKYISEMKFIPGGRYLYYAGRPNKFFNNCFTGDTEVITRDGIKPLGQLVGGKHYLLSPVDGTFKECEIYGHGYQNTYKYTFAPLRGRSKITWEVEATEDHKWPLVDGSWTESLSVGDVVPANTWGVKQDELGFAHGFVFGDGNRHGQLRLCADKDLEHLERLSKIATSVTFPDFADGDPVLYFNQDVNWKELPVGFDPSYISGFIRGWIAADGSAGRILNSVHKEHLEWFRKNAVYAGLVITGELRHQDRDIKIGKYEYLDHRIYIQNFSEGSSWDGFKVIAKEFVGNKPVFCPLEPEYNRFVLAGGIDTFNCYLLKAEEDTREDWANLSWKAESCLMTGGGIGVDYSNYRAEGEPIQRTGGQASGPIPKMNMVNEIGRRVMQGGSRRSAIYASLNWKHKDINQFLKAKDWSSQKVGNTGYTVWDIKQQDFNFPAPLDMTNISVNYDTEWLLNYYKTGDYGNVFLENVKQALKTAEPGFSFNFFDKENETLRNACCEVVSADDSDVCNLGSLNLGRIEDVNELKEVIRLATMFLLYGTLKAQLPYEKIYKTREKNRRLGLGLMGIHEWLIKRGYKYEVVPELHQWLSIYKGISDKVSKEYADHLDVSRPVANRAIAPTGTIAILAGTSSGIEPIFAVAYKRRYLKGKDRWHYQYVVDSAAQELISLYGIDPESVESALDLAEDFERRIKFQADVQDYVDMAISSTINLPAWGTKGNNEDTVVKFADTLAKYAPRLRGFTCYPDGARGGQPLTPVPYKEAVTKLGEEFEEHIETHDICSISGTGGSCGI